MRPALTPAANSIGHYREAEVFARRCVEIDPDHAWSWFNLAFIYDKHLRRFSDAEAAYRKCLARDPDFAAGWQNLAAMLAFQLEQTADAEEAFQRSFALQTDNAWTWTMYGHFLRDYSDRYADAEDAFKRAMSLYPDEFGACLGLAILYDEKLRQPSIARQYYAQAREMGASPDDVHYRLAGLSRWRPTVHSSE